MFAKWSRIGCIKHPNIVLLEELINSGEKILGYNFMNKASDGDDSVVQMPNYIANVSEKTDTYNLML